MIGLEDRRMKVRNIKAAQQAGARLDAACTVAGITLRTLQRWKREAGLVRGDLRPATLRPRPAHALTEVERRAVLQVANEARFADLPPARIVPRCWPMKASIWPANSTFHRVLREAGQTTHRGPRQSADGPPARQAPISPRHHARCGAGT